MATPGWLQIGLPFMVFPETIRPISGVTYLVLINVSIE